MALLEHIEQTTRVPMDRRNLEHVFLQQAGGRFRREQTMAASVCGDRTLHLRGQSAQIMLMGQAVGPPQHGRTGGFASKPTLAVKIADMRQFGSGGQAVFLLAYDVFADGRRVLQVMDPLRLDDDWRHSKHVASSQLTDELHEMADHIPEYLAFVVSLIRAFDCKGNKRTLEAKEAALTEISRIFN